MQPTKLEYVDWKSMIEVTEKEATNHERLALMSRALVRLAKEEIKKYSPPLKPKEEEKKVNSAVQ